AERIYVGKKSRDHHLSQQRIIDLLIDKALEGTPVLRLKGGDPYIFGRGGEEAQALAVAGIPFEVIPGISAAQGMSACAGIPLTHRDHAAAVVFATGHFKSGTEDLDWPALARPRQTVVIYMGVAALPRICEQLIAHGLSESTPAAVVENASCANQRVLRATLLDLPALALAHAARAPALIVIGEVVALATQLAPSPLARSLEGKSALR
ncbi:MAG: uroporphyrinogen-III C-methyltransferase, partial [Burkholderiales bacterium]